MLEIKNPLLKCGLSLCRVLLVLALLASGTPILSQTSTGEVNGTVTDPTGAFVDAPKIKLINQATRIEIQAFNVFNIQNYDVPSGTNLSAANPGRVTALAQGTMPRQLQFGLRFVF